MITKHSADDNNVKPIQVGLRLARVVSVGNGTVDVCPIGSSVVLHDIPVTSATTMSPGDVINLQMIDNRRFAFAQQNAAAEPASTTSNVTIQNGDVIIAGEGGAGVGTITGVTGTNGITGGGTSGSVQLQVDSTVARTWWMINAGSGLAGGGGLSSNGVTLSVGQGDGIVVSADSIAVNLATASGLNTTSGLAITTSGSGTGLSLASNVLGVNVANGIEISGNNVGLKTGSATGLYLNGGVLSAKPGIGVAIDGVDNTLYVKSAAAVNGITSGITVNANGVSVDSSVARDTWQVNPASGGGLSGGGNLSAVTPPAFSIATGTNTGLLLDGGLLKLDTAVAGDGLAMGTNRVMAVELSAASGLELAGTSPNKTLQISDSVAGFGLVINSNTKVLSVASDTTTLNVSENSVDVNTGYAFSWTNNHTWNTSSSISSSGAVSGFAGSGWLVRNSGSLGLIDIDELSVRGRMRVYELLVQQIRATNGSIFVSNSAKVASVTGSGPYTITIDAKDTDFCPFAVGDLLRAQRVDLGGVSSNSPDIVWQSNLRVDSISGLSFTATLVSGSAPAVGMEYVRLGNDTTTTRQSSVYLTADDSFAPYIDVVSGISSFASWGTGIRTRIGKLDGVTASITSSPGSDEFGIWAGTGTGVNNRYIRVSDKVVELRNVPIELFGNSGSTPQVRLTAGASSNTPSFAMGTTLPTSSVSNDTGIWMGQDAAGGTYKFRVGQITSGSLAAGILWNGTALTVTGAINVVAGGNAETTSGAQSKADAARDAAKSYSDGRLATIVDYSTGKTAFSVAPAPTGAGLYLGSNYLGYYNSGWKTYMDGSGNFYLGGTAGSLTWNGTTLAVSGNLTANAGSFAGPVTLSAAGGLWQGNGTWASVSNGLKLWADTVSHVYQINLTGATAGTFTVTVGANTTAAQAYNVAAATLQSAITGLASVGANNATVSLSNNIYTITFIGAMIGQVVSISANLTGITGGTKTAGTVRNGSLAGKITIYDANDKRVAIGNLKGDYDYASDSFGMASGQYANSWIGVDGTNGFRVMNSTTERFRVTTGGVVTIGNQNSTTEPYFSIDSTNGFRILRNAIARFTIDVSGNLNINNSAGTSVISMDTGGNASIAGVMTIGASGEIRQGTGTWSSTFTGTRLWNDSGVGRIGGYSSGTLQWYAGSDGKLYAGGGSVLINADGISIQQSAAYDPKNAYSFITTGSDISSIGVYNETYSSGTTSSSLNIKQKRSSGSYVLISSETTSQGVNAGGVYIEGKGKTAYLGGTWSYPNVTLGSVDTANSPTVYTYFSVEPSSFYFTNGMIYGGDDYFPDAVKIYGINVGTATGAAYGQIKASGTITGAALVAGTGSSGFEFFGDAGVTYYALQGPPAYFRITGDAFAAGYSTYKRGNTYSASNAVADNSELANNSFYGWNGSAYARGALIQVRSVGAFTGSNSGARMDFFVTAPSSNTEQRVMTLVDGRVGVGITNPTYAIDSNGSVNTVAFFRVNGTPVVGARRTGWAAATGTATRTTFATGTVTTAQLAERVKALIDDLTTHGLIGA